MDKAIPEHIVKLAVALNVLMCQMGEVTPVALAHDFTGIRPDTMFGRLTSTEPSFMVLVRHDTYAHVPKTDKFCQWRLVTVELCEFESGQYKQKRYSASFYPDDSWGFTYGPNEKPKHNTTSVDDLASILAAFIVKEELHPLLTTRRLSKGNSNA